MSRTTKLILLISLGINVLAISTYIVMEQKLQISERVLARFDLDLPVFQHHRFSNLEYHPLTVPAISVHGIAGFRQGSTTLDRLGYVNPGYREELGIFGRQTAGVRVRFKTDSPRIHLPFLKLKPVSFSYPYLSELGASGIDIYIDKLYVQTLTGNDTREVISIAGSPRSNKSHLVEIYLPSFSPAELLEIGVEPGSQLEAAPAFESSLVFYGTSITQGAAAPRPGLTFPAMISRELGTEFYNYGFSGNARGDLEIALALADINADVYVLEYSRQAPGTYDAISANLFEFCKIIKTRQPEAAIVIMTALYDVSEARGYQELEDRRRAFRVTADQLKKEFSDVYLVEGTGLTRSGNNDHLSDGTHPNAQGMAAVTERLLPVVRSILSKER